MRITNKIMQKNNLSNINTNKIYQDKLSNQMATQKKINRPSDDPVVAIRALRLRSNVTEITQYYSKNIPDAESWLSITEDGLKNLSQIITKMISDCTKGANGDLETKDRQIILEEMKALGEEIYATGDADYAGRYVFTGYRTDTSLSFTKEETRDYVITEQVDKGVIDSVVKVNLNANVSSTDISLLDINAANYNDPNMEFDEEKVKSVEVNRIRLAYGDCKVYAAGADLPVIEYQEKTAPGANTYTWKQMPCTVQMHSYEDPYNFTAKNDSAVVYVPETGEILLGADAYKKLMGTMDDDSTVENEAEIRISYEKASWKKGDLRPEHYFYCKSDPGTADEILYNKSYLTGNAERQDIEYDVGFNQTIRVNSTADQCFKHGIGREADDIVSAMQEVSDLEGVKAVLDEQLEAAEAGSLKAERLKKQLDAVEKALTYAKDKEQKLFEKGITAFQGYLDDASLCITECGTRSSKLALIENRMQNQKTSFETLKSENEDVDIAEVAIGLSSAELVYQAALMATGKVSQTTLLNYI